jgi:hypothetical protein
MAMNRMSSHEKLSLTRVCGSYSSTIVVVHRLLFAVAATGLGCGRFAFEPVTGPSGDASSGGIGDGSGSMLDPDSGAALGDALSTVGACPSPLVTDTFGDNVIDPAWTAVPDPDITITETGSRLVFTYASPAQSGAIATLSSSQFDLRDRCVTLDVASIHGDTSASTGFEVGTASGRMRISTFGMNTIDAIDQPATTFPQSYSFDPALHSRWQIRIGGGRVVALTLDGAGNPAQLLLDLPSFFDEGAARIALYSQVTSGNVNGGTAELEGISY